MVIEIKNRIEKTLKAFVNNSCQLRRIKNLSPMLHGAIKDFLLRPGKRIRPSLFVIGHLSYAKKPAKGIYESAIAFELLHDFMLVHDDIIDKSDLRRGKPSMHKIFDNGLRGLSNVKFSGADLAIVTGDMIYALAIEAFLSMKIPAGLMNDSLKRFAKAAFYTGTGEFIELIYGTKDIDKITMKDIYRIYDLKTADYTFASPLSIGATSAGASKQEADRLFQYGIYLGRAFQIKDDILGMFSEEKTIGKSILCDLQEAKKTLLVWLAFKRSKKDHKDHIKRIMSKGKVGMRDLSLVRDIVVDSGGLSLSQKQIEILAAKSESIASGLRVKKSFKALLKDFSRSILTI